MSIGRGGFEVTAWNEETYQELEDGAKLTRARISQTFTGDIDGRGQVERLMCYGKDGSARFVGLQPIEGSLHGRTGSFVIESIGGFDGDQATGSWDVIAGSGTEALTGLAGTGRFRAPLGPNGTYELDIGAA